MTTKERIKAALLLAIKSGRGDSPESDAAFTVLDDVNRELTGKNWSGGNRSGTRADFEKFVAMINIDLLLYLEDGGYSRLYIEILELTPDGRSTIGIGIASESTAKVKKRWREINV